MGASKSKDKERLDNLKKEALIVEHTLPLDQVMTKMKSDPDHGLTESEVAAKRIEYGRNILTPPKEKSELVRFLLCMFGGFAMLMWAGAALCFIAYYITYSSYKGAGSADKDQLYLGLVLIGVVVFTSIFQYYQEGKSSKVMKAFKSLVPQKALVIREGKKSTLDAAEIVPGDVVIVTAGDRIPADILVLSANSFKVDNSSLTGESEPQLRTNEFTSANPLETSNIAFYSTNCVEGDCKGLVLLIGDKTVMGRIAGLASGLEKDMTPLGKEIKQFVHIVSLRALVISLVFGVIAMGIGYGWMEAMVFFIGLLVANVPEGLMCTVTVSLTCAAKRMATKNCLVKNLEAVETLGSTSTICSDKTGTLTQNRMTVSHLFFNHTIAESDLSEDQSNECYDPTDVGWKALMMCSMLCSRSEFKAGQDFVPALKRDCTGDASESAMLRFAELAQGHVEGFRRKHKKVAEIPFNSTNKYQLSIHENFSGEEKEEDAGDSEYFLVMKGAPERIIALCSSVLVNGEDVPLDDAEKQSFDDAYEQLGSLGERVLGFADLKLPPDAFPRDFKFDIGNLNFPIEGLRFLGLISLVDPPRPNVPVAVEKCRTAGIRVVMVTGDHPTTAKAIARTVGIIKEGYSTPEEVAKAKGISLAEVNPSEARARVVSGGELKEMSAEELDYVIANYSDLVFARTSPQQKLRIVEGFQRSPSIVAVTGDGVNDSPALKQADIGVAMGIMGSDVSKQAAGMILLDDNFASIVTGVEEGRRIFDNLKKSIVYTLASNPPELIPFLLFITVGIPLGLGTVSILCIDIFTDIVPGVSFAFEEAESDIMKRKPRNPKRDSLVTVRLMDQAYFLVGVFAAFAGLFTYFMIYMENGFHPFSLFFIRSKWISHSVNDLEDDYGQQWTFAQRAALEYTVYTGYFVSIVVSQWCDLIICKTSRLSIVQHGMNTNSVGIFALYFETTLANFVSFTPGLKNALKLYPIFYYYWLYPLPLSMFLVFYDEIRKAIIRKYPGGFVDIATCY